MKIEITVHNTDKSFKTTQLTFNMPVAATNTTARAL